MLFVIAKIFVKLIFKTRATSKSVTLVVPVRAAAVHLVTAVLQMTAAEIGNYVKCGSNAIWVCVNNDGYLIERYLSPIPESGETI
jgi:TPP-dependent 2-oxoacid decarboxylase